MHRFVAEKNIQHFKLLLARETDEARRDTLRRLIQAEQAKLIVSPPKTSPSTGSAP